MLDMIVLSSVVKERAGARGARPRQQLLGRTDRGAGRSPIAGASEAGGAVAASVAVTRLFASVSGATPLWQNRSHRAVRFCSFERLANASPSRTCRGEQGGHRAAPWRPRRRQDLEQNETSAARANGQDLRIFPTMPSIRGCAAPAAGLWVRPPARQPRPPIPAQGRRAPCMGATLSLHRRHNRLHEKDTV